MMSICSASGAIVAQLRAHALPFIDHEHGDAVAMSSFGKDLPFVRRNTRLAVDQHVCCR